MKRLKWILPVIAILAIMLAMAAMMLGRYFTEPRQVGEDDLHGLTMIQVRDRYGEPNIIDDEPGAKPPEQLWIYYRGRLGGGTGITFRGGIVDHWEMRGAQ